MHRVPLALLTLFATCLGASAAEDAATPSPSHPEVAGALAAIDAWVEGTRHYDHVPGISVGIVHDQTLLFERGYGVANREADRAADGDTLYSICSISKLFTAIGVMQLRDEGELTLRDPVGEHLDWFSIEQQHADSGPIRIEALLTHSSGLPRESAFPYWIAPEFPFPTREAMIEGLSAQQTLYPAERLFQYSNLALSLAGEIIAATSGSTYEDYVRARILEPLGLDDTRPSYPEALRGGQLAVGYTGMHRELVRQPVPPFFTRGITPAAGFTSSVKDLARFASWQFRLLEAGGEEVLDANTLREMQRVQWVDPDWETTWGLGFAVRREGELTIVGHGGGCPGYITSFAMVPARKVAAIALTNAGDGPAGRLTTGILKTIIPALDRASEPVEEAAPDYAAYVGNYEARPWGGETAIRQWGDQLVAIDLPRDELGPDALTRLQRVESEEDRFVRLSDEGEEREHWRFERGPDGRAERLWIHSIYLERID